MRNMTLRGAVLGAAVGVMLPVVILVWTLFFESLPGPKGEALWLGLSRVFAAGYPTALFVDRFAPSLQQSGAGVFLYALLMVAVVMNWTLLGAMAGSVVGVVRLLLRRVLPDTGERRT